MEPVAQVPVLVWYVIHLTGIVLALSSRSHLGPCCALCTGVMMTGTTLIVAAVAAYGFLYQQPCWAASGCTLGFMAVMACFDRGGHEPDGLLRRVALENPMEPVA